MKSNTLKYTLPLAGIALALARMTSAAPLSVTGASATDAAAHLGEKYGVHIIFKGSFDAQRPVTFSLADADAPGARLQAINALANAAGADFQKTYVVSVAPAGSTNVPSEQVDSNALVAFPQTKLSAEDAVRRVAGADNAVVQISGSIGDTVTMSATTLSTKAAAREIAAQTHTQWKTFYAMTPRGRGHDLAGTVIDHTNGGSPIIEEPYVYYRKQTTPPTAATAQTPQPSTPQEPGQPQSTGPQTAGNPFGYGPMSYGDPNSASLYPYGFNTYAGNDPYSQNIYPGGPDFSSPYGGGYGNNPSYFDNGSGLDISNGFGGPVVFGGGY